MAVFTLVVGVFNFVLGYLLALALADPPFFGLVNREIWKNLWRGMPTAFKRPKIAPVEEVLESDAIGSGQDTSIALPVVATIGELPEQWQHVLHDDGLLLTSLVPGVVHFLRLEGAVYREHLLAAEGRARQALAVPEPPILEQLAADLRFINVDWSRKLQQAAELIEERAGRLGPAEEPAQRMARLLRDQGGQIAEIDREVHTLNFRGEGTTSGRRMLGEMQQLIHLANLLRDETQRSLAANYRQEGLLGQLDGKLRCDAATGLLGCLGLEGLFAEDFKDGSRPAAAMRISLDRFGKVNQRLGARAGDHVIKAVASYLAELTAAKCDKSVLARQAGSEFLVLANELTVEELTALGEHVRQSFEAAGFSYQGTDFHLTLTISVAAVAADASLADVLDRLETVREAAIKAGQNRSARWENGTAILTLPPAIPVAARIVMVEATAA